MPDELRQGGVDGHAESVPAEPGVEAKVRLGLNLLCQLISIAASQHRGYQRESRARLGYPAKLRPILCDIYPRRMNELR